MEALSTQHLFTSGGRINPWAWILFIATLILVIFAIRQAWVQTQKINLTDIEQEKKLTELELNLKAVRGSAYQSSTPSLT